LGAHRQIRLLDRLGVVAAQVRPEVLAQVPRPVPAVVQGLPVHPQLLHLSMRAPAAAAGPVLPLVLLHSKEPQVLMTISGIVGSGIESPQSRRLNRRLLQPPDGQPGNRRLMAPGGPYFMASVRLPGLRVGFKALD
jgi:hypothetical protein